MKTYSLVVTEHRAPWRRLRLVAPGETTLEELAGLLARELELEPGRAASFFRSARPWDPRTEFSSHGRSEHALQGVRLDRFALRPGSTFLYVHDLDHPRWHELRVAAVAAVGDGADGAEPLCVAELVTPAARCEVPLVSRVFEILEVSMADAPEEAQRAHLAEAHRLAGELLERGPEEIERLAQDHGLDVQPWLADLPDELAQSGLVDEAVALAARVAEVLDLPDLLANRAVILAHAERRTEAEAQVAAVLAHPAASTVSVALCADIYREFGDLTRAEELYRHALTLAEGAEDVELVRARMVDLLVDHGRATEARALELVLDCERASLAVAGHAGGASDELFPLPRVGRNDPCPCGSGQKFKKCCARESGAVERGELEFLAAGFLRALEHMLAGEAADGVRAGLTRFAGPDFAGLELPEALPLLPHEGAELAYLDWYLVDREEAPGVTLLDRYLEKRAAKLDPREARVLKRLRTSAVGLYRIELPESELPASKARVLDLLTGTVRELRVEDALSLGSTSIQILRLVEAGGRCAGLHEGIPVRAAQAERIVAELGPRWEQLARPERAPALVQAWLDALHALMQTP